MFKRFLIPAAILLTAALCGQAQAELVRRAEHGSVPLTADRPAGLENAITVRAGDVAWREAFRPAHVVRLVDAAPERKRPGLTAGLPAGTLLFAYRLSGGRAYCPVIDYKVAVPKVQCFRDLDGDGTFDAGYVTSLDGPKSQVTAGFVHSLAPMRKLAYAPADARDAPAIEGSFVYKGVRKDRHVFQVRVQDETLDTLIACEPVSETSCAIFGMVLDVTPKDGAAQIALLNVRSPREFTVFMTGVL